MNGESYSHILLITGSRDWVSTELIEDAFNRAWLAWGPRSVTRPLLVSGHCPDGADRLAETVWNSVARRRGFDEPRLFPADWKSHGRSAGYVRNQQMVDFVVTQTRQGRGKSLCLGFAAPCVKPTCRRTPAAHISHGTDDCMSRAVRAGIETREINDPRLPPF